MGVGEESLNDDGGALNVEKRELEWMMENGMDGRHSNRRTRATCPWDCTLIILVISALSLLSMQNGLYFLSFKHTCQP